MADQAAPGNNHLPQRDEHDPNQQNEWQPSPVELMFQREFPHASQEQMRNALAQWFATANQVAVELRREAAQVDGSVAPDGPPVDEFDGLTLG